MKAGGAQPLCLAILLPCYSQNMTMMADIKSHSALIPFSMPSHSKASLKPGRVPASCAEEKRGWGVAGGEAVGVAMSPALQ